MVVLGMIAGQKMASTHSKPGFLARIDKEQSLAGDRIEELVKFIETRYVDDVDSDALVEKAINAVLTELDPHSNYLPPEEVADLDAKMKGSFEGIGIEFDQFDDTLIIIHVIPDGPAMKAGLKSGDLLIAANDTSLIGAMDKEQAVLRKLKGEKGSVVNLTVLRNPGRQKLEFKVERDIIPIHSVPAAFMVEDRIGYIKIDRFSSTTYKEFMDALEELVEQEGMEDLIIDVRQNPGGYLQEAVNILSQLFEERNKLIVYTEGEHSKRTEYKTTGNPFFKVNKVTVLIDEGSASASEIVAGAIQDHDRGIIIGAQSFGKGLVQEQYKLSNGGALRLTVARYYTPSGRLIQRPYMTGSDTSYFNYHMDKSIAVSSDSTQFYTDNGRVVYGEGGIEPDIVEKNPIDWRDPEAGLLYRAMTRYALSFLEPGSMDSDSVIIAYRAKLPSDEKLVSGFSEFVLDGTEKERFDVEKFASRADLPGLLRAQILSFQFGAAHWYREMAKSDPVTMKAVEILKSEILYSEQLH